MMTSWVILADLSMKCGVSRKQANPELNLESLSRTTTQAHRMNQLPQCASSLLSENLESTRIHSIERWLSLWTTDSLPMMPDVLWSRAVMVTMHKLQSTGFWTKRTENQRNKRKANPRQPALADLGADPQEADLLEVTADHQPQETRTWPRRLLLWVTAYSRLPTRSGKQDRRRCSKPLPTLTKKVATQTNLSGCGKPSNSSSRLERKARPGQMLQMKL